MSTPDLYTQIMSLSHEPTSFDLLGPRNLVYSRGHAEAQVRAANLVLRANVATERKIGLLVGTLKGLQAMTGAEMRVKIDAVLKEVEEIK